MSILHFEYQNQQSCLQKSIPFSLLMLFLKDLSDFREKYVKI